jgi:hypothetical protein
VVLSRWVAAQCFLVLYVERLGVPYGGRMVPYGGRMVPYGGRMVPYGGRMVPYSGRMVPWLCFVASTAVLFARDVGIDMLTIIPFGLHWSIYLYLYIK